MFIVGSSTYAQLVIVVCIVSALSEVVTHNVPFLYFEVSLLNRSFARSLFRCLLRSNFNRCSWR